MGGGARRDGDAVDDEWAYELKQQIFSIRMLKYVMAGRGWVGSVAEGPAAVRTRRV